MEDLINLAAVQGITRTSPLTPDEIAGDAGFLLGRPASRQRQSLWRYKHFFSWRHLIGFLWLAPALTLLILNFEGHIIGAGIGCRGSHCRIDPYSTNQVQQAQELDKQNHDALGALLFVAKVLEVWFTYVAGCLVYNLALRLARQDRFPTSMLTVYAEFLNLLSLKDLVRMFREVAKEKKNDLTGFIASTARARRRRYLLYTFIGVVVVLCIVANLMGVATAVLVLPTLEWVDINSQDHVVFGGLGSSEPPRDKAVAAGCSTAELKAGNYSCTANLYAASLDELVAAAILTDEQYLGHHALLLPPVSQEDNLTFSVNISHSSESSTIIWAPSRQALRDFSVDLTNYNLATTSRNSFEPDYSQSDLFNRSLQARLQRQGPTIGLKTFCTLANATVFTIAQDRSVRCYPGDPGKEYVKCIRWGSGWKENSQAASAQFLIPDAVHMKYNLTVTIFATNQAAYFNNTSCLNSKSCDWDAIFSAPPLPELRNISGSQQTFEYFMPDFANTTVWCDTTSFLSFATYVLNPSPVSNILNLVELDVLDDSPSSNAKYGNAAALLIHPDWNLAAWSADRDGAVVGTRGSAVLVIDAVQRFISFGPLDPDAIKFVNIHENTVVQALSMITYSTSNISTSTQRKQQAQKEKTDPKTNATLKAWASVQVWKYGIDSRTSKLGAAIMLIGCVCVLTFMVLYLEESKLPTELVVASLLHPAPVSAKGVGGNALVQAASVAHRESGCPVRVRYNRHSRSFSFGHPS
jgi:hypothetical protein